MKYVKEVGNRLMSVDISGYRPATEEDLQKLQNQNARTANLHEITVLKRQLSDSDYQALKFMEGRLSEEEFAPIRDHRQLLRDKINELQALV